MHMCSYAEFCVTLERPHIVEMTSKQIALPSEYFWSGNAVIAILAILLTSGGFNFQCGVSY